MSNNFDTLLGTKKRVEGEKIMFGGDMYVKRHCLPEIHINSDNLKIYLGIIEKIDKIATQFGMDFALLSKEISIIFNLEKEEGNVTQADIVIQSVFHQALGTIACALEEINPLRKRIDKIFGKKPMEKENSIYLHGEDYCFIAKMLNELWPSYINLLNLIYIKRYFKEEDLLPIRERLSFILSNEYEDIRKYFKCVQCLDIIQQSEENPKKFTIH
jgi:hypothetical protein